MNVSVRVINNTFLSFRAKSRNLLFGWRQRKSRFLDFAGSSAFADDPAALEMTMALYRRVIPRSEATRNLGFWWAREEPGSLAALGMTTIGVLLG